MSKSHIAVIVVLLLWHVRLSTSQCVRTISSGVITFSCTTALSSQELNLYDLSVAQLDTITSIVAGGSAGVTGPYTSIPPNICLLRNLQSIDLSSNQIVQVDPTGSLSECLTNIVTLDLHSNMISQFPSYLINHMPNLENLYLQHNALTDIPPNSFVNISNLDTIDVSYNQLTTFELWALEVSTRADFSNNQISTITNKYFFTSFLQTLNTPTISLTNNAATINFTDASYEMYNQCQEASTWLDNEVTPSNAPYFTFKMARIDFGTSQINCSCDQLDFLTILKSNYGSIDDIPSDSPIRTATCARNAQNLANSAFINSSCISSPFDMNSTVNFAQVYPRFCEINSYEGGSIMPLANTSAPTSNASTYPHYESAFMNPGACFFTFTSATAVTIRCTNETSNTLSTIPSGLLNNSYMTNINTVSYSTLLSSLPTYLCSLPSKQIDLSYQAFTTLTDATFPCLDSFTSVSLAHNQIASVNMATGDFHTLATLNLSSNLLTSLPYSILRPTPSSLRYLDLRNNSISSIDLYVYTLKNITVNLDNNPINSSSITNPQGGTLSGNGTSSVTVIYPSSVTNTTYIIQDSTVASLFPCGASFSLIQSTLAYIHTTIKALLLCTCQSYALSQLYTANGFSITKTFSCSNASSSATFASLNNVTCANETLFQLVSCPITTTTTQTSTSTTTATSSLNTSFTTVMDNSSTSISTLNASNQTQSGSTLPTNSNSSQSTTPVGVTTLSNDTTLQNNATSSAGTTSSGTATSSGGTTSSGIATSSASTTSSGTVTSSGDTTSSGTVTSSAGTITSNSTSLGGNVTTITSVIPTTVPSVQSSGTGDSRSVNVGLIAGLTVGLGFPFLLLLILLIVFFCLKSKKAAKNRSKKPVSRAAPAGKAGGDALSARVQSRNLRSVRLAPLPSAATSKLPDVPVKAMASAGNPSSLYSNSNSRAPIKGIPIRPDSVRSPTDISPQYPPNSNALNNSSSFRPITNNTSAHQAQLPQQQSEAPKPRKPRAIPLLNIGGDIHH